MSRGARPVSAGLRAAALLTYAFLYLPILVVIAYSFNEARYGTVWTGFSTRWYEALLRDELAATAARNTLVLAVASTAISTVLGGLLGYALHRHRFPGARALAWLTYVPVVTPDIVMAVALLLAYALLRAVSPLFELGMGTMVVAHVTFQLSFVAIVVRSRLAALDPALEEAARDLYANAWQAARFVVLPLAAPGVLAGALLAFTLSVDDFVVSFFTSGPTSRSEERRVGKECRSWC